MSETLVTPAEAEETRIRDAYARRAGDERYAATNPAHLFMLQGRERAFLSLMRTRLGPIADKRILEIGCGNGQWLLDLVRWGARPDRLTGIDLIPARIEEARRRCPEAVRLIHGSGTDTGLPEGGFDVVLQSTVFSSILAADVRRKVAGEMLRVLAPGGVIVWYDFLVNNPCNADVRGVPRAEIASLFPGCRMDLERLTLAPPIARALVPVSRIACDLLERIPWLCTHYLGLLSR